MEASFLYIFTKARLKTGHLPFLFAVLIAATGVVLPGKALQRGQASQMVRELPKIATPSQVNHALEVVAGDRNAEAGVSALESLKAADARSFILVTVRQSLPAKHEDKAFAIARAVITEANHHGLDPLFLLAVIGTESKFDPDAVGSHGEIGLMQVLPLTARELSSQAGLSATVDSRDPAINIRLGTIHLARLRLLFKHKSKRYIAAYNMGALNVRRLVAQNVEPEIYSSRVIANYRRLYADLNKISAKFNANAPALALASASRPFLPDR